MKSLQNQMVWKVLLFTLPIFLIVSFVAGVVIEKKAERQIISNLEYLRDSKFLSINKDNLHTAFDFTNLTYTSYLIDEKGELLVNRNFTIDKEVKDLCATQQVASKYYVKSGQTKYISIKKNGNLCLVYESNTNNYVLLGQFIQGILLGIVIFFGLLLLLLLRFSYKKVYNPITTLGGNLESSLLNKWGDIKIVKTNISEIEKIDKFSKYLIEILQKRGSGNTEKISEIKEFENKFISKKLANEANKFKLAVDAAVDMVVIADKFGYINYTNKAVSIITGISSEDAENKKITELWHKDDDIDVWKKQYDEVLKTKGSVSFITTGVKKNNLKFEANVQISPIKNADDSIDSLLIVERDVTEEKQKERIKNEFVSVVSHELRTPMTVIRGYSTILAEGKLGELNEKQKEYINKINTETGQLLELANDMLDLQKFESGRIDLHFEQTNIADFVKNIMDGFVEEYNKKGLTLTMENNLTNPMVNIDLKYFQRVVTNLLTNAFKYTPKGSVQIFLVNPDEHTAVMAVKDTGVGISDEALPHLFERFYQAQGVMQRKQEGSGLGLSIVKRVTEAHNGLVWVESKADVGSTFYVAIPTA